jgi:hypothetical protein
MMVIPGAGTDPPSVIQDEQMPAFPVAFNRVTTVEQVRVIYGAIFEIDGTSERLGLAQKNRVALRFVMHPSEGRRNTCLRRS